MVLQRERERERERERGRGRGREGILAFVVAIEVSAFGKQEIDNTLEDGEF